MATSKALCRLNENEKYYSARSVADVIRVSRWSRSHSDYRIPGMETRRGSPTSLTVTRETVQRVGTSNSCRGIYSVRERRRPPRRGFECVIVLDGHSVMLGGWPEISLVSIELTWRVGWPRWRYFSLSSHRSRMKWRRNFYLWCGNYPVPLLRRICKLRIYCARESSFSKKYHERVVQKSYI